MKRNEGGEDSCSREEKLHGVCLALVAQTWRDPFMAVTAHNQILYVLMPCPKMFNHSRSGFKLFGKYQTTRVSFSLSASPIWPKNSLCLSARAKASEKCWESWKEDDKVNNMWRLMQRLRQEKEKRGIKVGFMTYNIQGTPRKDWDRGEASVWINWRRKPLAEVTRPIHFGQEPGWVPEKNG